MEKIVKNLVVILGLSVGLTSCGSVTKKMDAEQTQSIFNNKNGGLVVDIENVKNAPCAQGYLAFKNIDTGKVTGTSYVFGMFGTSDATNIIAVEPGRYLPISGSCTGTYESGGFRYTNNSKYKVIGSKSEAVIVEKGVVTYPGSFSFSGKSVKTFSFTDNRDKIEKLMDSKYPNLKYKSTYSN